jgi:hypothetical protein
VRFPLIALIVLLPAAAGLGCATRDPESLAAEQAKVESGDDEACRQKGAEGTPAYEACRQGLADARAQQAAVQEQKRRDFDRVLGAGTEGQSGY